MNIYITICVCVYLHYEDIYINRQVLADNENIKIYLSLKQLKHDLN